MKTLCGIDLGGTKIEGVLLAIQDSKFEVIERLRVPTEKEHGYNHILSQIKKVVALLEEKSKTKITTLGIGTPGTLDPTTQTLKNSNTVCLNGQPFKKDLENLLGFSIEMANDANCFALAEATLGAVPDQVSNAQVVFGIIMGTGVGGGVILNGKVLNGRHGIGGEWGHNFLHESGGPCFCGQTGCVETIISGTGLENFYEEETGTRKRLKAILELYEAGKDPAAKATIERLITYFGKGVASIINVIDPDAIVIGGGVGNIDLLYTEGVESAKKYVFNNGLETKFLKPKLGDSAGVFGAAMLVN
ncbi:ROK family protein [Tamlana sp. I1]|uniref:ROK family protein n=1 Tax=Tamlana sp. I1 TaxID=2762061 RepID=UPI00188F2247|nr:ROK family protein [Tamlana sp. I1]